MNDKTTQLVIQKDGISVTLFKSDEIPCFLKTLFEINLQVNYPTLHTDSIYGKDTITGKL